MAQANPSPQTNNEQRSPKFRHGKHNSQGDRLFSPEQKKACWEKVKHVKCLI
jgi:hypothetical protein